MSTRHRTGVSVPDSEFPDYSRKPDRERPTCRAVKYDRDDYPKDRYKANWRLYPKGCRVRGLLQKGSDGNPSLRKVNRDGDTKISADFRGVQNEVVSHAYVDLGLSYKPEDRLHQFLVDSGATNTSMNKDVARALDVIGDGWDSTSRAGVTGPNGLYAGRTETRVADGRLVPVHKYIMLEVGVYIEGEYIETLRNVMVQVMDGDSSSLLGVSAIGKFKRIQPFKPMKNPEKWEEA